jgi:erythromycin esterase-like protein
MWEIDKRLLASLDAAIQYLEKVDSKAAGEARNRYGCFDEFGAAPAK